MSPAEQANAFQTDLRALIDRYRAEFDLPFAVAIGVLEIAKQDLYREQTEDEA